MLHVTNGGCTVEIMRRAPVVGDIVAWADVLHEGPVPALAADELRPVRAAFLATMGPATCLAQSARHRFARGRGRGGPARPRRAGLPDRPVGVELICVGSFPGRPGFAGLGGGARRALTR